MLSQKMIYNFTFGVSCTCHYQFTIKLKMENTFSSKLLDYSIFLIMEMQLLLALNNQLSVIVIILLYSKHRIFELPIVLLLIY